MTKTQAGRLLTLAYLLKTQVPEDHFDMGWFCNSTGRTTACALGWATTVFPEEFHLNSGGTLRSGNCGYSESIEHSAEFFGVTLNLQEHLDCNPNDEWDYLFGGGRNRTPKEEAAVIEEFVKSKGYVYG